MKKWTPLSIRALKGGDRFATVTCYDATSALLINQSEIPLVLVGDSLGMVMQGHGSTLPVTMDQMVYHTQCVTRVITDALVVSDMPFMSYQVSLEAGLDNAGRLIKEGGADAVKMEGGARCVPLVRALVDAGIPVVGHLGLTPQSCLEMGGYRVQGRAHDAAERMISDALALEAAGIFALVVECVPEALGDRLTQALQVPVIGIGAGPKTDAQILVWQDMLGLNLNKAPRFVKRYGQLGEAAKQALSTYAQEVKQGAYPAEEHCY